MPHFQLRAPQDGSKNIELWLSVTPAGKRAAVWQLAHVYTPDEQYPLGIDRYVLNRRNLFVDVLSIVEMNAHGENAADNAADAVFADYDESNTSEKAATQTAENSKSEPSPTVSLKNLAQRAARVAADGSGNARRFKDARALLQKISSFAQQATISGLSDPITEVRKSHNWKKNQPFKDVSARPDAWFVCNVFSRSNPRKDPFVAFRSLDAVWNYMASHGDEKSRAAAKNMQSAAETNFDYPAFGDIAGLVNDSNMLVFPTDESFITWIRSVAGKSDEVARETLVETYMIPQEGIDEDDPAYIPAESTGTVLHVANVLEKARELRNK